MKLLHLFFTTFMVGALTFGGGYAIIPVLKGEFVDSRHWVNAQDFGYAIAVGQVTPGPVSVLAAVLGWKVAGLPGALVATVGLFLPAFLSVLLVCRVYAKLQNHPRVLGALHVIYPAVGALLASVALDFGKQIWGTGPASYVVAIAAFVLMGFTRLSPAWLFGGCLLFGLLHR